ncbi:MAG: signal peptidase II [Victivallales bacterium]|nr:signal peptidase II [Victivallales bacterium]
MKETDSHPKDAKQASSCKAFPYFRANPWPLLVMAVVFLLDWVSKEWILRRTEWGWVHDVIPGFFEWVHVRNTGAAWGMFSQHTWVLALISLVAFLAILYWFPVICKGSRWMDLAFSLLLGGIAGNMVDRIFRGYVVDFLSFHWGSHYFPAFNIADSAITVAVIFVILLTFFEKQPAKEQSGQGK